MIDYQSKFGAYMLCLMFKIVVHKMINLRTKWYFLKIQKYPKVLFNE